MAKFMRYSDQCCCYGSVECGGRGTLLRLNNDIAGLPPATEYTEAPSVFQEGRDRLFRRPFWKEDMGQETKKATRKPRADSIRNRERLLSSAATIFAAGGPDASLEAVARHAGVGIGTLYRHFPTREALFEAVYRHEVDQLSALAGRLLQETEPVEALRRWLHANVQLVATKKGMLAALALAAHGPPELYAYSFDRLTKAVGSLLERAVEAGEVRSDLTPEELLRALVGMCYAQERPGWQESVMRLMDIFLDGLCIRV
jgi:AcrR family transcriptional regulator